MKSLIAIVSLIATFNSFAATFTSVENGDIGLSKAHVRILSVKPICPKVPGRMSCMAVGSTVTIEVLLNGCVDRLGGTFSSFNVVDKKGILNFAAINIAAEASRTAMCIQANRQIVQVGVPFEGEITLKDMEFTPHNN